MRVRLYNMADKFNLSEIAEVIGLGIDRWPGNCYAVSCKIVNSGIVEGRAVYGHYYGQVTHDNPHFSDERPFQRHGWIISQNKVNDYTRWVFEEKKPYLFIGRINEEYDEGGNRIRRIYRRPPPIFDSEEKQTELNLSGNARQFVLDDLLGGSPCLTFRQAIWIANLDIQALGTYSQEIYAALKDVKLKAAIPIDNWRSVME